VVVAPQKGATIQLNKLEENNMPFITLIDRRRQKQQIRVDFGEQIIEILNREHIPIDSVIVKRDGEIISENQSIKIGSNYTIELIEGYDIESIRNIYKSMLSQGYDGEVYHKRYLSISKDGRLELKLSKFGKEDLINWVENTFIQTISDEKLLEDGDSFVFALSGGIDSTSMLILFNRLKHRLPKIKIYGATYEDFKIGEKPPVIIKNLVEQMGIHHEIIPEIEISNIFNTKKPIRVILNELMKTPDAHFVMYIDHHVTRRALEHYASKKNIDKICLGLHITDLLAGILNTYMTGYVATPPPIRVVGPFTYIFPLSYITKKELKLYLEFNNIKLSPFSDINPWELHPLDRNFYYYLADQIQFFWPGIHVWMYEGLSRLIKKINIRQYVFCRNCGSPILPQVSTLNGNEMCDVCQLLDKHGYLQ